MIKEYERTLKEKYRIRIDFYRKCLDGTASMLNHPMMDGHDELFGHYIIRKSSQIKWGVMQGHFHVIGRNNCQLMLGCSSHRTGKLTLLGGPRRRTSLLDIDCN